MPAGAIREAERAVQKLRAARLKAATTKQQRRQIEIADAYAVRANVIRVQLLMIERYLTDNTSPGDVTWGHVGNLGEASGRLREIVKFLMPATAEEE